jgi:hypothetical protein
VLYSKDFNFQCYPCRFSFLVNGGCLNIPLFAFFLQVHTYISWILTRCQNKSKEGNDKEYLIWYYFETHIQIWTFIILDSYCQLVVYVGLGNIFVTNLKINYFKTEWDYYNHDYTNLWNRKWNGSGTISHSLTLWGNEKTIGLTITTRDHGLFDLKIKQKTSHFDIWSIWPLSHTRQINLNMSNLIDGF